MPKNFQQTIIAIVLGYCAIAVLQNVYDITQDPLY